MHALRPERVHGEREHDRRVHAAREADDHAREGVLVHVVAHAQHDRAPHALLARRQRRQALRLEVDALVRLDHVHAGERCLEGRRPVHDAAADVHRERAAIEHQLVLPADEVRVDERQPGLPRARGEVRLALRLLALLVGRGVQRDHELRARGAHARGHVRMPDVLADERRDAYAADLYHDRRRAGVEVALLVEHLVVRQPLLAVAHEHGAVPQPGGGVVQRPVRVLGVAHEDVDAARGVGDARESGVDALAEPAVEQQVLGRVAGDRELGRHQQPSAQLARRRDARDDLVRIPGRVADHRVELGERDA